ncbi:MAG: pyruvate, phosphate dikinase/phosphoenolpyruvate synthase regulator [Sedimenticola sp.]
MKKQSIFFISDGTGITAERVGESILTQFDEFSFKLERFPFVRNAEQAKKAISSLQKAQDNDELAPIVFSTFVDPELTEEISSVGACVIDLFGYPSQKLGEHLGIPPAQIQGRMQAMGDRNVYQKHMDAINFSVDHDDAHRIDGFDKADIIILGLSRGGKTPTCMYLSIHYFLKAANYPLTLDELSGPSPRLPSELSDYKDRLLGLIIEPKRLSEIRQRRKPGSDYASLETCKSEVKKLRYLYEDEGIFSINTTDASIHEIAIKVMNKMKLYD